MTWADANSQSNDGKQQPKNGPLQSSPFFAPSRHKLRLPYVEQLTCSMCGYCKAKIGIRACHRRCRLYLTLLTPECSR